MSMFLNSLDQLQPGQFFPYANGHSTLGSAVLHPAGGGTSSSYDSPHHQNHHHHHSHHAYHHLSGAGMLPTPGYHPHQQAPPRPPQQLSASSQRDGRIYSLIVEQQPDRARMCGFGDKDRRPITPPPCIRLLITDAQTGREIPFDEVDSQHFILNVDLWDESANTEVNLVRHSHTSPSVSISMASTTSYPPPLETPQPMYIPGAPGQPHQYYPGGHYPQAVPGYPYGQGPHGGALVPQASPTAGMFTRNLIGSVTVSASQLTNLDDKPGFWFVLQDLSVRTEGSFRLKLSFIDVGVGNGQLNQGHCPVLAFTFSDVFTVWSAKKFPGVKESTPLSKCFATQGVKIPIRKDGGKGDKAGGNGDFDDDG